MISRRNFVVIAMMMLVLLFMFQFSQIIKENGSEYEVNDYSNSAVLTQEKAWKMNATDIPTSYIEGGYVLYCGATDGVRRSIVEEWCTYTKRNLMAVDLLSDVSSNKSFQPEMLLLDCETFDVTHCVSVVEEYAHAGIPVVFLSLPDVEKVQRNTRLQALLGISEIRESKTVVEGIRLFSGFLIGGEAVYKPSTKEEEKLQDLNLEIPWYIAGKGTKTYMVGLKDEEEVEREDFPRLIWRNYFDNAFVFVVSGEYSDSRTALGILDAFVYDMSEYQLYPVVNAQNISVVDYPTLSNENSAVMEEVYSRNTKSFLRDIAWPSMLSLIAQNKLQLTCYIGTKQDYEDPATPDADQLFFYLQQMKEIKAEAGRSLRHFDSISLTDKAKEDDIFYREAECEYPFGAYFVDEPTEEFENSVLANDRLHTIHTVTAREIGDRKLVDYYTDRVTLLGVTANAEEYSYSKDLELRSINTALAYSNTLIDMHKVIWPEESSHQWQNYFDELASNITTYYKKFNVFDQLPMSQSDYRTRILLNLSYSHVLEDNIITLEVKQSESESWFILRTHGKSIKSAVNAEYTEIEKDVYALHATGNRVRIILKDDEDLYSYKNPFVK